MELEVVEGDITELDVDAVANAANNELWMGAGVAGAIKRAGGSEIEQEAVAQAPIAVGQAIATGAGNLRAKHVVHAAVMGQDLQTSAELISQATRRTLEVADELGCSTQKVRLLAVKYRVGANLGGRAGWRFRESDVEALWAAMRPKTTQPIRRRRRRTG